MKKDGMDRDVFSMSPIQQQEAGEEAQYKAEQEPAQVQLL